MPGSSNTSFIPKHTPNKIERKNSPRQLFIGTIIVRVLFFAVLIASIGVFAYDRKLGSELAKEIEAFNAVTASFSSDEEKLQQVISLDERLAQANDRFSKSYSLEALFKALEKATVSSVQLRKLKITKESDTELAVEAEVITDTFDSVIFQRSVFEENEVLKVTEFNDVGVERSNDDEVAPGNLSINTGNSLITFQAHITVDPVTIPAVMISGKSPAVVEILPPPPMSVSTSTDTGLEAPKQATSSNKDIL